MVVGHETDQATSSQQRTRREARRAERDARRAERRARRAERAGTPAVEGQNIVEGPAIDIAPDDPILPYLQSVAEPVDVDRLELDSDALGAMKEAGIRLVVPLVSQGELIGILFLGPRLSEQEYSTDDRKLLANLAAQAAPAVRVAQLVRQQEAEAAERQRIEQELQVAKLIQQNFLPKQLPELPGWQVEAYYRPARVVGGDFYDFIELEEGKVGIVVGDVTDKGVPAAMVMAATRGVIRAAAERFSSPAQVLQRVNEMLEPDMPPNMFVTCLYGVLEPETGRLVFANAGHNLPYVRMDGGVQELRATGLPLGIMPGITYDDREATIEAGHSVLLHSDGLAEAHDPDGEMYGFPRLRGAVASHSGDKGLIDHLLTELDRFTGPHAEQEDDVTLVLLRRTVHAARPVDAEPSGETRSLTSFDLPSEPGNERVAMERVVKAVGDAGLSPERLERLKTAVAEATMNAMEHGNQYRGEVPVSLEVLRSDHAIIVRITDRGGGRPIPQAEVPDLDAKLAGEQSPRGWGLFLIKNMVDDVHVTSDDNHHTVELVLNLKGESHDDQPV
jgi:serine phosphatase RsbU (regulator of sigma subunit)/anti-sigma regulatory factor (Ser/Thr protein kinase)